MGRTCDWLVFLFHLSLASCGITLCLVCSTNCLISLYEKYGLKVNLYQPHEMEGFYEEPAILLLGNGISHRDCEAKKPFQNRRLKDCEVVQMEIKLSLVDFANKDLYEHLKSLPTWAQKATLASMTDKSQCDESNVRRKRSDDGCGSLEETSKNLCECFQNLENTCRYGDCLSRFTSKKCKQYIKCLEKNEDECEYIDIEEFISEKELTEEAILALVRYEEIMKSKSTTTWFNSTQLKITPTRRDLPTIDNEETTSPLSIDKNSTQFNFTIQKKPTEGLATSPFTQQKATPIRRDLPTKDNEETTSPSSFERSSAQFNFTAQNKITEGLATLPFTGSQTTQISIIEKIDEEVIDSICKLINEALSENVPIDIAPFRLIVAKGSGNWMDKVFVSLYANVVEKEAGSWGLITDSFHSAKQRITSAKSKLNKLELLSKMINDYSWFFISAETKPFVIISKEVFQTEGVTHSTRIKQETTFSRGINNSIVNIRVRWKDGYLFIGNETTALDTFGFISQIIGLLLLAERGWKTFQGLKNLIKTKKLCKKKEAGTNPTEVKFFQKAKRDDNFIHFKTTAQINVQPILNSNGTSHNRLDNFKNEKHHWRKVMYNEDNICGI